MMKEAEHIYRGKRFAEVVTATATCDGCVFEFSEIGRDCLRISRPECRALLREDGLSVIFKYTEQKTKSNGRDKGTRRSDKKPHTGRRG